MVLCKKVVLCTLKMVLNMSRDNNSLDVSRRNFLRQAAYITPAVLTLNAVPMAAKAGSYHLQGGVSAGKDKCGGQSLGDDLKTSAEHPQATFNGNFGCTNIKKFLF